MSLRINPQYEKIMPHMSNEEFEELKASIQDEGQHYPIIANEDLEVLDGHHRLKACNELKIEPDFEVRKFENKLIEKKFVIESNLRRRHLTSFQLVELGVPLLEIEKKLAKKRQIDGGKKGRNNQLGLASNDTNPASKKGKASAIVAKKIGLSTRTFERGKKIIEKATEEEKQKLREGKKSISRVYRDISSQTINNEKLSLQSTKKSDKILFSPQNISELMTLLDKLNESKLFCPICNYKMFECSKCHKNLRSMIKFTSNL
jgi:ParB-like chromosome segregation protein Spo0J